MTTYPLRTKEWLADFCKRFHEPDLTNGEQVALFEHLKPFTVGEALSDANTGAMKMAVSDFVKSVFQKREARRQEIMCDSPMVNCPLCKR